MGSSLSKPSAVDRICATAAALGFSAARLPALFTLASIYPPSPGYAAWIDSKTGQPVQVEPYVDPQTGGRNYDYKSGHAFYHGRALFWDTKSGTWRDGATGQEVQVEPYVDPHTGDRNYDYQSGHAFYHGHQLFWQPAPPPHPAASTNAPPPSSSSVWTPLNHNNSH